MAGTEVKGRLSREKAWLGLILGLAVALRVGAAIYLGNEVRILPGIADQTTYHRLALRVLGGHGFTFADITWPLTAAGAPTAHWSYLYTFYLTAVYAVFGPHALVARLIQAVAVGLLHPYLVWRIGRHVFDRRGVALAAAGLTAVYVYFVYYAAALMTESFYITGILAIIYLIMRLADRPPQPRKTAVGLGLALAATVLLRQLFLLLIPFLFLWLWWVCYRRDGRLPVAGTLIALGLLAGAILPFTIYNTARFERFVLLNTNAGFAFFWANHPVYGTHFEPILPPEMGSYAGLIPRELWTLDEAALESELMARGIQFVLDDPGRYVLLSISRIPAYFIFWPSADSSTISNISRVGSFGLMLPLMLLGLARSLRRPAEDGPLRFDQPVVLLYLFMTLYTAVHLLSWALIRYRLPVDAVLLLFAGLAVVYLLSLLPIAPLQRLGLAGQP